MNHTARTAPFRSTLLTFAWMGVILWCLLQATASAYWPPVQNVQASVTHNGEYDDVTVVLKAMDPVTGAWVTSEVTYPQ